jgi:peptidoglycan-associated lipoprotein
MKRLQLFTLTVLAVATVAAACGGNPEPAPAPEPNADSIALERARQDSIAREMARQDSIRRAMEEVERARRQREADSLAAIARANDEIRAMLAQMINFDFDRSNIRSGDATILDGKVGILRANPGLRIRIAGHCDERGSDEYNLALGNRRAASAKQYLVNQGIGADRIEIVSYGEERPMAMGATEEAWAQNRRAEFEIVAGGDMLVRP